MADKKEKGNYLRKALGYLTGIGKDVGYGGKAGSYLEGGKKKKKRYDELIGAKGLRAMKKTAKGSK